MAEIEIPQYFICPISLQIMKDPVAAMTGITYDRESIEQWLSMAKDHIIACPVTKQPLTKQSGLTPNHTLRRLIQAWCLANATNGVDRIPTPKSPLEISHVLKLVRDLEVPHLYQLALMKMKALAMENERNRSVMAEAGVAKALISLITRSFKEGRSSSTTCILEALRILRLVWSNPSSNIKPLVIENLEFINSLTWVLQEVHHDDHHKVVNEAMPVLQTTIRAASSSLLSRLKLEFFNEIVAVLKTHKLVQVSQQAIKSALQVLIETCSISSNRMKIVEAGAVFELVEIELEKPEKNITELVFEVLAHLCSCADGRERFLQHAGSIAVISKRILRVSPATSDRAVHILSLIAKFSASKEVVLEMLRIGAVTKLCMVMQADCDDYLKAKVRGILRLHSSVWNNSPCIAVYLLTRYQR
ncbi:RING-type E3 ubiquitin transferase [Quillaja saponaria]|uniref:U-box domain-containing protein n=1 Tax=Quillaja saponaria TaxID=32244 RepID=A0AAD7QGV9_QUISA|nr:RING-type E3 ubiquitin transferase [Quillaja saponaria]